MAGSSELRQEVERLRGYVSRLATSIRDIDLSLDLEAVMSRAVENARMLAAARYGVMVVTDRTGTPVHFITSGLTPDERRQLTHWMPEGLQLFEALRLNPGPVRLASLQDYVHAIGIAENRACGTTFLGMPMHCCGEYVGSFFLADKTGVDGFTADDEEALNLIGAIVAAAVVNARIHADERRRRSDFQNLFEDSPVGMMLIDKAHCSVRSLNREALRLARLVRPGEDPVEAALPDLVCRRPGGAELPLGDLVRQIVGARTGQPEEVALERADGTHLNLVVNVSMLPDEAGAILLTLQDMTPFDQFNELRTRFLATVGHDLREPLTAIRGAAGTLLADADELDRAEQREYFRIIAGQSDRMRKLISDLQDSGSIQLGTLSVRPEPCQLADLVEQARDTFVHGEAGHDIGIDIPPDLPPVMADRRRITQVLGNLLANARNHSRDGAAIRIAAAQDGQFVAVTVADQGVGIAPEQLPDLFRHHRSRAFGPVSGNGLGLAICKGLVEAHGGRISAASPGLGRGATLTFTIPVVDRPAGATRSAGAARAAPAGQRDPARVLVIDDDPQVLRLIRTTLTAEGHSVFVTGDHGDLSRLLGTERPQLVMLDLALPGTDGIELLQREPGLADVPVIIVSGYDRDETIARALDAGAEDYIVKPFSTAELAARVRLVLRRQAPATFAAGKLAIDYGRRRVSIDGQAVTLTATEYEILRILSRHAGTVVTYETLLQKVWSGREYADANLVRMHVSNLRGKLGDSAAEPVWIFGVRAVGYRMASPDRG